MGSRYTERHVSGRQRVDREEQTKYKFDPLRLEVKYPGTAILLLECQEKPVLLAAAAALAKFGTKSADNLEILFDLEIVDSVIPLIKHEDLFTRRFAAKLLAEMTAIPNVRNYLLDSKYYIPHFAKVLVNDGDTFMQEFSSLILAELSKDMYGVAQLLKQCPNMNFLFERIQSPDPDVKKNTIEIMYNLIQDPVGAKEVTETNDFNLTLIYQLFNTPYPEIQELALKVISDFVVRNRDDRLQEKFRETHGLQALMKFLDKYEWQDLHAEALRILRSACDNPKTVEMLNDIGGIRQIMNYMDDSTNSKLFAEAFDVAVCLAHTPAGRRALYTYGIMDYLLRTLRGTVQPDIYKISCEGVGKMTLYNPAAKEFTAENSIKHIFDVLKNEVLKMTVREAAMFASNELLKYDLLNCKHFLDIHGENYLLGLIKQPVEKASIQMKVGAVEGLMTIANHASLRHNIINTDMVDGICAIFECPCRSMDELKIACCNALSILCVDKLGRDAFLRVGGPRKLYNLLSDVESIPIRNAAVQLVQLLSTDPVLSDALVTARFLPYMINNRSPARAIPSWDTCIDALFKSHLPIKFAFTGRLSLHDVTQDGFYVVRRNVCPFPVLDDIFRFKFCPLEPVYVVNCIKPCEQSLYEGANVVEDERKPITPDTTAKGDFMSGVNFNSRMDMKFGQLQCDGFLYNYLELIKFNLNAAESKDTERFQREPDLVNINYVAKRAKMLAKFVARQMSGPDPITSCMDHQLEIHLKEIKHSIETSVIPLGMLRVGSYLERALLFKVMADRIGLPAALVRGEYGKAWVEIAVPKIEPPEETSYQVYMNKDISCADLINASIRSTRIVVSSLADNVTVPVDHRQGVFPTRLMKPNFIVDLMNTPGDLLPIGSVRAKLYCEKQLTCDTICCE